MKTAGIREARQNLSALLETIGRGREVVITDRGRPVARLVPPTPPRHAPFRSHRAFRAKVPRGMSSLVPTLSADRDDRL